MSTEEISIRPFLDWKKTIPNRLEHATNWHPKNSAEEEMLRKTIAEAQTYLIHAPRAQELDELILEKLYLLFRIQTCNTINSDALVAIGETGVRRRDLSTHAADYLSCPSLLAHNTPHIRTQALGQLYNIALILGLRASPEHANLVDTIVDTLMQRVLTDKDLTVRTQAIIHLHDLECYRAGITGAIRDSLLSMEESEREPDIRLIVCDLLNMQERHGYKLLTSNKNAPMPG